MTLQEVFNNALFGVRAQGYKQSKNDMETCLYRGPDGCKCHIGHSIRDEDYSPAFEDKTVDSPLIKPLFPGLHPDDLLGLQQIHDWTLGHGRTTYENSMRGFAAAHDLEYTAP